MSYVQELTLCLATSFQTFCELNCKRFSKSEDKFQLFLDKEVQDTGLSAFSSMSNLIHNTQGKFLLIVTTFVYGIIMLLALF